VGAHGWQVQGLPFDGGELLTFQRIVAGAQLPLHRYSRR
jgi:hypothetical protein